MALTDSMLGTSSHVFLKPRWMVQLNAVTCMGNHHWNCKIQSGIHHFVERQKKIFFPNYHFCSLLCPGYCSSGWAIKTCTMCVNIPCYFPKTCQIFPWIVFLPTVIDFHWNLGYLTASCLHDNVHWHGVGPGHVWSFWNGQACLILGHVQEKPWAWCLMTGHHVSTEVRWYSMNISLHNKSASIDILNIVQLLAKHDSLAFKNYFFLKD